MLSRENDWFPIFNFNLLLLFFRLLPGFSLGVGGPDQLSGGVHVPAVLKASEMGEDDDSGESCETGVLLLLDDLDGKESDVLYIV